MQSLLTLALVVVVVAGSALEDGECILNGPHPYDTECCEMTVLVPNTIRTTLSECIPNYTVFPWTPSNTTADMENESACIVECSFNENGLLTSDMTLDKAAIMDVFLPDTTDADHIASVINAVNVCFSSYTDDIDPSDNCKSGADEFYHCLQMQFFTNCPSSLSSVSSECDELRAWVYKCM